MTRDFPLLSCSIDSDERKLLVRAGDGINANAVGTFYYDGVDLDLFYELIGGRLSSAQARIQFIDAVFFLKHCKEVHDNQPSSS